VLAFIIFFAGAQLAITSFSKLLNPAEEAMPSMFAIYIIVLSILGKLLLAGYLKKVGKSVESAMLIANARNMQNDVVISVSVLVGLVFTFIFKMPIIDTIAALLVSAYIMVIAFKIFMQTNLEMMDGVEDSEIYKKIISAANSIEGVSNPHRIRVRKMAHLNVIALDIEIEGHLTLNEAHDLALTVESAIKDRIPNVYDVLVHTEPKGNIEPDEVFGVSEEDL
jgi:cation diffusion facilitator family transporter